MPLHRRNYLRRVVSWAVGRAIETLHRAKGSAAAPVSITLDPPRVPFGAHKPLVDVLPELSESEHAVQKLFPSAERLGMTYEDDIAGDPSIAHPRVSDLYGVTPTDRKPALVQTNPFRMKEVLDNYHGIADLMECTEYG